MKIANNNPKTNNAGQTIVFGHSMHPSAPALA